MRKSRFFLWIAAGLTVTLLAGLGSASAACNTNNGNGCVLTGGIASARGPAPGEQFTTIAQGLFAYTKTDLRIGGAMPIEVTRVYRSEDQDSSGNNISGDFGVGTRLSYDMFLYSNSEVANGNLTDAEVVMPDGGMIQCRRTTSCTGSQCSNTNPSAAQFRCDSQPTGAWFSATILYNASTQGFDLTRRDGTVYSFGHAAPLQKIRDRYGNQITITHAGGWTGNGITKVSSSTGRYVNFTHNSAGVITQATDSSNRSITYTYIAGANNQKLNTVQHPSIDPKANVAYGWGDGASGTGADIVQIVINVKNPGGNLVQNFNYITYGTGALHRLQSVSSQLPASGFQYDYDTPNTGQVKITLPDNSVRVLTFDSDGYVTKDQRAYGVAGLEEDTTFTRDPNTELITSVVSPVTSNTTRTTGYTYDSRGNVLSVTHTPGPDNTGSSTTTYTYEATYSRVASIKKPLTPATTFSYFDLENPPRETVTDPLGRTTTITRVQTTGQIASSKDQLNNTTTYTYDPTTGDPRTVVDPMLNKTTYNTDNLGRTTSVLSPMQQGTTNAYYYSYDDMDNLTSILDPYLHYVAQYQYDFLGERTQATDGNGNVNTITIPGTLDTVTTCDAAQNCSVDNRDTNGRRSAFTDKRGVKTIYHYDKLGRVTEVDYNNNNMPQYDQRTLTFSYDMADRMTQVVDSRLGIGSISYSYGGLENVKSETIPNGSAVSYSYDLNGRRTSMTLTPPSGQSGKSVTYTYWNDDQLNTMVSDNPSANVTITYDGDGRRSSLAVGSVSTTYGYDAASRLTSLFYQNGTTTLGDLGYNYDGDSRLIGVTGSFARTDLPPLATATYSNTNQVATWNGNSSNYDGASNITKNPVNSAQYKWDSRNMLAQQTTSPITTFSYDALGRRFSVDNPSTTYTYDGTDAIRSILTPSGSPVTSDFARLPGGEVVKATTTGGSTPGTWVPLHDISGSTIALVDSAGAITTQFTYDPDGSGFATGAQNSFPYRYSGMELDPTTGLYHSPSRYYSPQLTRPVSGVGPTSSGGPGGNTGSPSDVMGFAGGGSSLTASNEAQNYGIAQGASLGASAAAAGLAVALGDTAAGAAVSLAVPYVGPIIFAATELALLLNDILGGSPSIPYQLLHPAHSPLGLRDVGQTDQIDQSPNGAPDAGTPLYNAQAPVPDVPAGGQCGSSQGFTPVSDIGDALGQKRPVPCDWLDNKICAGECAVEGKLVKRCYYIEEFGFTGGKGRFGLLGWTKVGGRNCECSDPPPCGCR